MKLKEEDKPEEAFYTPIDRNSDGAQRLLAYLVEEHRQALVAYDEYFNELKMFRRAIAAKPNVKVKTFPWPGASNFIAPIIRIAGDAVKARVVNTLLGPQPFWICSATNGSRYGALAKPVEKFLDWSQRNDLMLADMTEEITDQVVYLGKCPVKVSWNYSVKKVRTYSRKTKKESWETRVIQNQPRIQPILLENWLEPWGLEESTSKPWNSQRIFLSAGDIKERAKQGLISNDVANEVIEKCLANLPPDMVEYSDMRKLAWAEAQAIPLYETHVQFDIDGDGFREEIIALWSYDMSIMAHARYNFFFHTKRPLFSFFYLRHGENRSSADGLAQLLWSIQEATSTYVNQRSDNITIANTKFWKGKRNSGIKKGEQIWPGKVMILDDPEHDLVADSMGQVSPESFTQESLLRDYGERISGISDPQLGREFNNPRVAATTTLSVLQEGNRRFDMVIKLMRETYSRIGMMVLQLYQQFEPRVNLGDILNPEDEISVRQVLDMSPEEIEKNFIIQINTSNAGANKETQRQGMLALFNLIIQFYGQVVEIATNVMIKPEIPQEVKDMVVDMASSSYKALKEIVVSYDINDPDSFLVDVGEALRAVESGGGVQNVLQKVNQGLTDFAKENGIPVTNPQPVQAPAGMPPGMPMQGQGMQGGIPSEIPVGGAGSEMSQATA